MLAWASPKEIENKDGKKEVNLMNAIWVNDYGLLMS